MNRLVENWTKMGLLDGTLDEDKEELSSLLEDLRLNLTDRYQKGESVVEVVGFAFPVLVRLFNEKRDLCPKDVDWFYEDFKDFYNRKYKEFKDIEFHALDADAEFVECYILWFKGKV